MRELASQEYPAAFGGGRVLRLQRRKRSEPEDGDCGFKVGRHGRRADPVGGQHG